MEYRRVVLVRHVGELMREPCHGLGLAATCRVLDEVVMAGSFLPHSLAQFSHCTQLLEAWEDGHFLAILFIGLNEVFYQVEQRIGHQNACHLVIALHEVAVHVGRGVFSLDGHVLGLTVERQKTGVQAVQLGGHEHIVVVDGKMYHAGLQHAVVGIAVVAVLVNGVEVVLPGTLIFQFAGDDRQSVDEDTKVEAVVFVLGSRRVFHLAHDRETVLKI